MTYISVRFFFDSLESAVDALITVMEDARDTDKVYEFGSLSAKQILASGLVIRGEASQVVAKVQKIPGAVLHVD